MTSSSVPKDKFIRIIDDALGLLSKQIPLNANYSAEEVQKIRELMVFLSTVIDPLFSIQGNKS